MPKTKKQNRVKSPLIATSISFTAFSIVYQVKTLATGVVACSPDIKDKDLVLNPTIIDKDCKEVIFTTVHAVPHFYQALLDKSLKDVNEYAIEHNNIYKVGDVVGYILLEEKKSIFD